MNAENKKIVIIGAGFSGLAAGKELLRNAQEDFIILEARDRIGGRVKPGMLGPLSIDLGGMWLGPTQTRLKELAAHYQVATYPTPLAGKSIFSVNGKMHLGEREEIDGLFNILEGVDYLNSRKKIDKMLSGIDCSQPWNHPEAKALDAVTVEYWLQKSVKSKRIRTLYRLLCFSLFCAESDQISMLFFLHYIKSGDGLDVMISADAGGGQNFLFHGGVHQVADQMGHDLAGKIRLNSAVTKISWTDSGAQVDTIDGSYAASQVIIALPPTIIPKIQFQPTLPRKKNALHKRLVMGSAIKFWVLYETPFWRDQGYSGSILIDDMPCTPIYDVSPTGQDLGVMAGFFDGDHALQFSGESSDSRKRVVTETIAKFYGPQALEPVDYVDNDWTTEEWSEGCYGAFAGPGVYHRYGEWLKKSFGPFHWAGTETSPVWTGYIEGAIRSGESAAKAALAS
ncbi:MAG: NAD(P)/FAD-dependent oxidoreductase [Pseudomonadota bacterium]